eukprot:4917331-Prymnesium_polylepis.1
MGRQWKRDLPGSAGSARGQERHEAGVAGVSGSKARSSTLAEARKKLRVMVRPPLCNSMSILLRVAHQSSASMSFWGHSGMCVDEARP